MESTNTVRNEGKWSFAMAAASMESKKYQNLTFFRAVKNIFRYPVIFIVDIIQVRILTDRVYIEEKRDEAVKYQTKVLQYIERKNTTRKTSLTINRVCHQPPNNQNDINNSTNSNSSTATSNSGTQEFRNDPTTIIRDSVYGPPNRTSTNFVDESFDLSTQNTNGPTTPPSTSTTNQENAFKDIEPEITTDEQLDQQIQKTEPEKKSPAQIQAENLKNYIEQLQNEMTLLENWIKERKDPTPQELTEIKQKRSEIAEIKQQIKRQEQKLKNLNSK